MHDLGNQCRTKQNIKSGGQTSQWATEEELVAHNKTRTLLELRRPEDYALQAVPPNVNGSGRVQNA
jgi:hypothetical protein